MEKVIKLFLLAYFFLFPFGQFTRIPLALFNLPPEVNLYLTDLSLAALLSVWAVGRFLSRKSYQWPSLAKPIALFVLLAAVSLAVNARRLVGEEVFVSVLYLVRWIAYAGLYLVISDLKWPGPLLLIWAGATTAVLGLIQYWFWPDIRHLQASGWDPHYYRVVGTLLDPGFTGIILVLTLILLVVHFQSKKILFYGLLALVYLGLALTYSRSSYLAYLTGMGVITWLKKAPRLFLMVIIIGAITLAVLPRQSGGEGVNLERESTINARIINWRQNLEIIGDHPLFGVGFNAYRYIQKEKGFLGADWQTSHAGAGADASLLFVWATTGILGLLAYLKLWRQALNHKSLLVTASLISLFMHALFLNSLFYPWVMGWLWVLLATEKS